MDRRRDLPPEIYRCHTDSMPSLIRELCRRYTAASEVRGPTSTTYTPHPELRLMNNGVVWHQTAFSELLEAGAGLSDTWLSSHTLEDDQRGFMAFCAEFLVGPNHRMPDSLLGRDLGRLVHMCMGPRDVRYDSAAYLVFPLLEGVTKMACLGFVDGDGMVHTPFSVGHRRDGSSRDYGPAGHRGSSRVSSVRDLLWHYHDQVADVAVKGPMKDIEDLVHDRFPGDFDGFETIYRIRNSVLHGSDSLSPAYEILNLAFMIAIGSLGAAKYDERRSDIVEAMSAGGPASYYPSGPNLEFAIPRWRVGRSSDTCSILIE